MPWLFAANALRSDDPDLEAAAAAAAAASPNPNFETAVHPAAAANIAMHPITGTFVDPSHESAFTAQLFRMAYLPHVLLMALNLAYFTWMALVLPAMRTYWGACVLSVAIGLVCRVLLHRTGRHDPVRSQWMGSWAWTVLAALSFAVDMVSFMMAPAATCASFLQGKYMVPFVFLLYVLISGTHGLSFACWLTLMTIALTDCIVGAATCHDPELDPWIVCTMGILVLGSAATHTAELYLRRSYAEKVQEQQSRTEEATRGRQLEERMEQLQASLEERMEQLQTSNERLLYDVQRRGRPLDDDDDRSAIRRGLLAGSSQREFKWIPYPPTDPSEGGGPTPSDSPPPSLPLGPPSSTSSNDSVGAGQGFAQVFTWGEAELAAAALVGLATAGRDEEAQQVDNPAACGSTSPHTMPTPEQALEEACHCIQSARTNTEAHQVVRTLAMALGAKRAEIGSVKALHAVLLQVLRPSMESAEACAATGASMSTFLKWRGRVQKLQSVPLPSSLASALAHGTL